MKLKRLQVYYSAFKFRMKTDSYIKAMVFSTTGLLNTHVIVFI